MLTITIPGRELFDEKTSTFSTTKEQKIVLEHSLVSLSKWEAKWHKPFMSQDPKTQEETIDYVRCMTITQNVDTNIYNYLTKQNIEDVYKYIENQMTATWFNDTAKPQRGKKEVITSELIYYWMIALKIPIECQKWHLNRLLTLIRVANIKNSSNDKKMGKKEILKSNAEINASRRKLTGSSG